MAKCPEMFVGQQERLTVSILHSSLGEFGLFIQCTPACSCQLNLPECTQPESQWPLSVFMCLEADGDIFPWNLRRKWANKYTNVWLAWM